MRGSASSLCDRDSACSTSSMVRESVRPTRGIETQVARSPEAGEGHNKTAAVHLTTCAPILWSRAGPRRARRARRQGPAKTCRSRQVRQRRDNSVARSSRSSAAKPSISARTLAARVLVSLASPRSPHSRRRSARRSCERRRARDGARGLSDRCQGAPALALREARSAKPMRASSSPSFLSATRDRGRRDGHDRVRRRPRALLSKQQDHGARLYALMARYPSTLRHEARARGARRSRSRPLGLDSGEPLVCRRSPLSIH